MPKIKFDNVTVTYANGKQNVVALDKLSVEFAPDCFNVVVGASGCGKSTLLRTVAGQLEYDGLVTLQPQGSVFRLLEVAFRHDSVLRFATIIVFVADVYHGVDACQLQRV